MLTQSTTQESASVKKVALSISLLYGTLDVFSARNREPKRDDYDYTSDGLNMQDFLVIVRFPRKPFISALKSLLQGNSAGPGRIYFLITAATSCKFRLVLFDPSNTVALTLGFPFRSNLKQSENIKYTYKPQTRAEFTVAVTPFSAGNPDLVIIGPGSLQNQRQWTSSKKGADYIVITPTEAEVQLDFQIIVTANTTTMFTILVTESSSSASALLLSGFPQADFVQQGMEKYFKLFVPVDHGEVSISVDSVTGSTHLYVNSGNTHNTFCRNSDNFDPGSCDFSVQSGSHNLLLIKSSDSHLVSNAGVYYITVFGDSSSSFIVRGHTPTTVITLSDGMTITDSLSKGQYNYFRLFNSDTDADLLVDVRPLTGDADLMISCLMQPTGDDSGYPSRVVGHYNYSSQHSGEDAIRIPAHDPDSCQDTGVLYIAVYGYSTSVTKYKLTAMHHGGTLTLRNGQILQDTVFTGLQNVYRFSIGVQAASFSLRVTPTIGDCDVFVKLNSVASANHYDYSSINWGLSMETIDIPEEKMCSDCWLSIAVVGFKTTQYSIVAQLVDTTLALTDALPLIEGAAAGNLQYYSYTPEYSGNLTIVLTIFSGLPIVYTSRKSTTPNALTNDTSVNNEVLFGNLPIVTVRSVEPNAPVYIGIGGFNDTKFTVRANIDTGKSVPLFKLINGIPQSDYIAIFPYGWKYYVLPLHEGHETVDIRLTEIVGDVDIYVSKCPFLDSYKCLSRRSGDTSIGSYLPNETYSVYTSYGNPMGIIHIDRADIKPYTYIIGMKSDSFYAEYSLSVTVGHTSLTLVPGVSVMDHVEDGETDKFSFYMGSAEKVLTIVLDPVDGDCDLFVRCVATNGTWQSFDIGTITINIDPFVDSKASYDSLYEIIVIGYYSSTYTILAKYESTNTHIKDGVAVFDTVQPYVFNYYVFRNNFRNTRDFKISIAPTSGNPEVIVTLDGETPDWLNFAYESVSFGSSDQVISIKRSDEAYSPCLAAMCSIRIGVYSFQGSSYSISVTSTLTPTLLQAGIVQSGSVPESGNVLFKSYINRAVYTISYTFAQLSGHVDVYAFCSNVLVIPDKNNHIWYLNADTSSVLSIPSTLVDANGCRNGTTMYLSVVGKTAATFTVLASFSGESLPLLYAGKEFSNSVQQKSFDYYYVKIGHVYEDLKLSITIISGDARIYVGRSWDDRPRLGVDGIPDPQTYFVVQSVNKNQLIVTHERLTSVCATRTPASCYLMVAVLGVAPSSSTYRLLLTVQDSLVTLSSGVSVRSHVEQGTYQYYKYSLTIPGADVVVVLTAFFGDPDLYIGTASVYHPSQSNYTWMAAFFGSETVTLQAMDIANYCTLSANITGSDHGCDLYMAVYGSMNSSYSIVASMDEGFRAPISLVDNQVQTGTVAVDRYVYYRFVIGESAATPGVVPESIVFTLSPLDEGDEDLYVTFGEGKEPGVGNFDYRSTAFAGSTDEIVIHSDMPHYCFNCVVNVAVFGFAGGSYNLVAHSKGFIQLQTDVPIGGHVNRQKYRYYSYYNPDSDAEIMFTVTPITGDPDLFINAYTPGEGAGGVVPLPAKSTATWKSYRPGGDSIMISYKDKDFCYDCEYIVGVYGYKNTSYTLLVSASEASVIQLTKNRPQIVSGKTNDLKYFKIALGSSAEDITLSLTCLDTGSADMFAQIYNATYSDDYLLPDPSNPATFSLSTAQSQVSSLNIKGPHPGGTFIIITVKITATTHISVVATTSQDLLVLRSGVPQNHYVAHGYTEYFRFPVGDYEYVQVSLSAQSGDPDLVISSQYERPYCTVADDEWWVVNCFNFTWSSRLFSSDIIVISRDFPCQQVLKSTRISPTCNPSSLGEDLYIGVFGFETSQFSITASPLGERIHLLPGQPQVGATVSGYICSHRSERSGACLDSASVSEVVQIAYFSFHVSVQDVHSAKSPSVFIAVHPHCHNNDSVAVTATASPTSTCRPGCSCGPLELYVTSCPMDSCTEKDMFPSPLDSQNEYSMIVNELGSTLFISSDPASSTYQPTFCDPSKHSSGCNYYIAVLHHQPLVMTTFSISARTPEDMALITCDAAVRGPDGIRVGHLDSLQHTRAKTGHYYDICADTNKRSSESIVVSVEQCSGSIEEMYACDDISDGVCERVLPSPASWRYYADPTTSCTISGSGGSIKKVCSPGTGSGPALTLPKKGGNYYLLVNGTGEYYLRLQDTLSNGLVQAPMLVRSGIPDVVSKISVMVNSDRQLFTLSWAPTKVLMPGMTSPVYSPDVSYTAYVIDEAEFQAASLQVPRGGRLRLDSPCALTYLARHLSTAVLVLPLVSQALETVSVLSHDLRHLEGGGRSYRMVILATCDSACLSQVSKTSMKRGQIACDGAVPCKPQYALYDVTGPVVAEWDVRSDSAGEGPSRRRRWREVITVTVSVCVAFVLMLLIALSLLARFYLKLRSEDDEDSQFELTEVPSREGAATGRAADSSLQVESFPVPDRRSRWSKIGLNVNLPFQPLITTDSAGDGIEESML